MKKILTFIVVSLLIPFFPSNSAYGSSFSVAKISIAISQESPLDPGMVSTCWDSDLSKSELENIGINGFSIHYKAGSRLQTNSTIASIAEKDTAATSVFTALNALSGNSSSDFCKSVTGLSSGTSYYFAVVPEQNGVPDHINAYNNQIMVTTAGSSGTNTQTSSGNIIIVDKYAHNNSILLQLRDLSLISPQQYFASCYVDGNENDFQVAYVSQPAVPDTVNKIVNVEVKGLKSGTNYHCQAGVATPDNQGHTISRNSSNITITTLGSITSPSTTTACQSPYTLYNNQCVDPIPPCKTPIANSVSCIDKINDGQYIEHYSFSCLPGYEKTSNACVGSSKCTVPFVEYQGKCVDSIPPCESWPSNAVTCIDKIENGQRISRYNFQCMEGFVRSGNYCVAKNTYQPSQAGKTQIPPAGYEDDVIVNTEAYQNPFPDTNTAYDEGKAAAELYRRGVIGGYPDGEFKGARKVNRAEAAKFLLLAKLGTVEELQNTGRFPDVAEDQWYVKFIIKAANLGVIEGYPDGNFRPQNTVNTVEFLKMLTKMFGLEENLSYTYTDVNSSDWFAKYAGAAQKYGLFPGRSTQLNSAKDMTRDEVAVAIYQYLKNR